jgi:hypothetical protein
MNRIFEDFIIAGIIIFMVCGWILGVHFQLW